MGHLLTPDATRRLHAALADRYTIVRELGAGGMATVYLAHDLKHDRDVAIKVLRDDVAQTVGAERFLREIRLVARLTHPHILALHDSGSAPLNPGHGEGPRALYYVMPFVEGQSLRERLDTVGILPIDEAVRVATEIADALDYAHRHDVIHRDIKPENILLHDGHALVADFGIGKALSAIDGEAFTRTGMSVGTPAYISPEQAVGEAVDGRSDLYSLGCVLYEMLVGEPPFTGPNTQAVIAKRFVQTPADVCALRDSVPRVVAAVVQRALARAPVDRFETAAALLAAFRADATAPDRASAPAQSIAVLPFENLGTDRDDEFFGDGIAEDIINALAQIDGLHVAARTSAFTFKGQREDLRVIGDKLNVATVLEGSVRKAGNRLRITAQLISVADGYHLWSERYDRDLTDVFAVQDEIATAIARRLQVTFVKPAMSVARPTTKEVEAYELYVRGRALTVQRGAGIREAVACFERALELDPESAPTHVGVAEALRIMGQYGFVRSVEVIPRAKAALARALELEPESGHALGVLALITFTSDMDGDRAMELFKRALAADPTLSEIRCLYAAWGLISLRQDDAHGVAEMERARTQDPLSSICAGHASIGYSLLGRHDDAIQAADRGVELNPDAFSARMSVLTSRAWAGDTTGALAAANPVLQMSGRHPWILCTLTQVYAGSGDRVRAEAMHQELLARSISGYVQHLWIAISALALGRVDEAIDRTIRSVVERDAFGPWFLRWPGSDAIRRHPRYPELLALTRL